MPELRIDPLSGIRVIVAGRARHPARRVARVPGAAGDRPGVGPVRRGPRGPDAARGLRAAPDGGAPDSPGWRARVVPNLYPALGAGRPRPRGRPARPGARRARAVRVRARARGAHEVIVNSPKPVCVARRPRARARWRRRWASGASACARTRRVAYVHVIVNEGREAGASLPHTHAQLYALPFVPAAIARERERFTAYSRPDPGPQPARRPAPGGGAARERIVAIDSEAVALCPFASRVPFHLQVVPRRPRRGSRTTGRWARAAARGAARACERSSAHCRRSTCGCAPRRATPSASAGGST